MAHDAATSDPRPGRAPSPARVGTAAGAALTAVVVALLIGPYSTTDLFYAGSAGAGAEVVAADFPDDPLPRRRPYDGQEYYLAARFFPDLAAADGPMGGPDYRLVRILMPAVASLGGEGTPVVVLMALCGIAGVGLAAGGLASVARRHGRDPRLGYAAALVLSPAAIVATSEPLAFGLGFTGLALVGTGLVRRGAVALALAGLAREGAVLIAVAVAVDLAWRRRWAAAAGVLAAAAVPVLVWAAVVRSVIDQRTPDVTQLFGFLHLEGISSLNLAATLVTLLLVVAAIGFWRDAREVWLVAAGFLACFIVYGPTTYTFDSLPRVSAPAVALGLAGYVERLTRARAPTPRPT
jgi:hypothetical protein